MNPSCTLKAISVAFLSLLCAKLCLADVQTEFYISPTGDDSNPGTLAQPFKSLNRARDEVQAINASMTGDIVVNLLPGDYYLDATFQLRQDDSGSNGHNVIYQSYGDPGSARIIGGKKLSNWEKHEGNIYRTFVDTMKFEALYVTSQGKTKRATMARHPNNEYLLIEKADEKKPLEAFYHKAGDIPSIADISGLQVYVWPGAHNWANEILPIESIDADRKITLLHQQASAYLGELKAGSRYFIQGALALLDQPGEFYLDKANGYLYYSPITGDINSEEVIAPTVRQTIKIRGEQNNLVKNIQFKGLTVMVSDYRYTALNKTTMGNFVLANAQDITIHNNRIANAGLSGLALTGSAASKTRRIVITNNDIFNVGGSGILARGQLYTKNYTNGGHTIRNNRIHDIARIAADGAGIQIANVDNSIIANNEISNAVHYGIQVKGTRWQDILAEAAKPENSGMLDGVVVTEDNKYDFNPGRFNTIKFNRVFNVNIDSQDTGIYKSGGTYKTTVDNNLFYDSGADFGYQKGIYLDDVSDFTTVKNNIVYGVSTSTTKNTTMNVKGTGNVVTNNIFHFNSTGMRLLEFNNLQTKDSRIEGNIFYSTRSNLLYDFATAYENKLVAFADNNLFYTQAKDNASQLVIRPFKKDGCVVTDTNKCLVDGNLAKWQGIAGHTYDLNSLVADPKFVDVDKHNYRLQADSLALTQLGFTQINTDNIGLDSTFAYNRAPLYTPTDLPPATEGKVYSASIAGQISDPEGDDYTVSKVNGPAWLKVNDSGELSGTPSSANVGTNTFALDIADSKGAKTRITLRIEVTGISNQAPVYSPASLPKAQEGKAYSASIAKQITDPDGDDYTVTRVGGSSNSAWLKVSPSGQLSGTPTKDSVGTDTVELEIVDTKGATTRVTLSIEVAAADPDSEPSSGGGSLPAYLIVLLSLLALRRRRLLSH